MRDLRIALWLALAIAFSGYLPGSAARAAGDEATALPSLASVEWDGPGTSLEALEGKTAVVITYVSWCPICNEWAPTMLDQVKRAVGDKPAVIMAISTDTPNPKGKNFLAAKGLVGPNILYGYDPTIAKRAGFTNEFWNYIVVGPDGKTAFSGNAGMQYIQQDKKTFSVATRLERHAFGEFAYVDAKQSPALQKATWAMELGYALSDGQSKTLRKGMTKDEIETLTALQAKFVEDQAERFRKLTTGDTAAKLAAYDRANAIVVTFKGTEAAKEAKQFITDCNKDPALKMEFAAKKLYEQAELAARRTPDRLPEFLGQVAQKYPDTVYGKKAAAASSGSGGQ